MDLSRRGSAPLFLPMQIVSFHLPRLMESAATHIDLHVMEKDDFIIMQDNYGQQEIFPKMYLNYIKAIKMHSKQSFAYNFLVI